MIEPIKKSDLLSGLMVFHRGYETVAEEFGLTEDNCPDRGRASLRYEKLLSEYENDTLIFVYKVDEKIVGILCLNNVGDGSCKLNDIVVLPEYRHHGYGSELLAFCKLKAKELGARKIALGMIDDNQKLKNWYKKNGFVNVGYKKYDRAPFTVGYMECKI